ncbi:MAG: NADPH:quinone reductase [Phylliscum demangeonii]|nr:MAG: NADPH:quinone reductase [Phylliscum demangeonii]
MKGVRIEKTGGPEVLQYVSDLAMPQPGDGEILVKNEYIGLNYIDTYYRTGLYASPKPEILGCEAESVVVAVGRGDTHGHQAGDRVCWVGKVAYAEYSVVAAARAIRMPASLRASYGAGSLIQGLTALTLVRESYRVQPNDWVLVQAAAGGCGLWLCQLLRAIGARTIGTASSAPKLELARRNGATHTVNYATEDLVQAVQRITAGAGVRVVYDGVGQATFEQSLEVLAPLGSLVSFGNASGDVPPFTIRRLSPKNLTLLRPSLFGYIPTRDRFEHYANELFDFMARENLDPHIHHVYPLQEVAKAHEDIEGRKTTGKLLLKP